MQSWLLLTSPSFFEEEKAIDRDFIPFTMMPHGRWGEAGLQQGAKGRMKCIEPVTSWVTGAAAPRKCSPRVAGITDSAISSSAICSL